MLNDQGSKHSFVFAYITASQSEVYIDSTVLPEALATIQKCQCLHFLTYKRADNHIVGKESSVGVAKNLT